MTNEQLRRVLQNIDLSKGRSVRAVGDLEAVLIENYKTVTVTAGRRYESYYNYLVLLKDGEKAGIILKCDCIDIHIYVLRKYRKQHIVSRLINDNFLKNLWPDITSITCANISEYEKIKHFAEITGFGLREDQILWVR